MRGEAGIGKTSLIRAFAGEGSLPIHICSCDNLRTPRPFGPMLDVLRAGSRCRQPLSREEVFTAALAWFDRPRALVIEDVHWADEATLDLITFVARRIRDIPALLVLTYRDDEVGRRTRCGRCWPTPRGP